MRFRLRARHVQQHDGAHLHQGHAPVHGARARPGTTLQPHRRPVVSRRDSLRTLRGTASLLHQQHLQPHTEDRARPDQVARKHLPRVQILPQGTPQQETRGETHVARTPGPPLRARRPTADDAGGKPHRRSNRRFWSGFEIARRRRLPDRPRDDAQPRAESASVAVRQPARAARSRGGGGGGENRIGERHVVRDERRPRVFDFVGDRGVGISIARRDDRARDAFGPGGDARAPRGYRTAAARRAGSLARRARGRGGCASRRSRHRVRV